MTIYNSFLLARDTDASGVIFLIMLLVGIVLAAIFLCGALDSHNFKYTRLIFSVIVLFCICVATLGAVGLNCWVPLYQVHKVVIHDAMIIPELLNDYEIINQEGQILTIQAWEPINSEDKP